MTHGLTSSLAKAVCRAAGVAAVLSCIGLAHGARAEEHWQYANTRRVDIGGLAFAHTRPILYVSFSYRGTGGAVLTPSAIVGIDLETGKAVTDVLPRGTPAADPVISPDDAYLAYRFYDRAHLIGLRRLADGKMSTLPDESPGTKYPSFFSPDSRTLAYLIDVNWNERSPRGAFLAEYSLDTASRNIWPLGVNVAWDLQRLSDNRVIFTAMEPNNKEVLRRFAGSEVEGDRLYYNILVYTFDKSTGAVRVDPLSRLTSAHGANVFINGDFRTVQGVNGRRYYVLEKGYQSADLLAGDERELKRVVRLENREVLDFIISDDEKWLAYVYWDTTKERTYWGDGGYDEDLEIRNMVTGETRRIDLRKPPFSDVANQQRLTLMSGLAAWLASPPFDDVEPVPSRSVVDSDLIRHAILVLIGLATLAVWVGGGIVSGSVWSALGISVTGTLLFGFVLLIFTVSQSDIGHDMYDFGFVLALIVRLLGYLLPAGAIIAVVTSLISNFMRRRRAQQGKV